jgi:2,4-dienoyl-CoA reductase-like NADH-dependent reductase (Old Yellow Enzyme family)
MGKLGIFSNLDIGPLRLANRIVISPMCQYSAKDGNANDWHLAHYLQMALSGAGMIVIESTAVSSEGRITLGDLGIYSDQNETKLKKMVSSIKQYSSAAIVLQLSHAGRKGSVTFPWKGSKPLTSEEGSWQTVAPSAIPRTLNSNVPAELDLEQIKKIKDDFIASAIRASRAGVDALEIHIAHGYLLHQFFSPISNKRTDKYGGSLKNRYRLIREIVVEIRKALPRNKIIGARVTAQDWLDNGSTIEDCVELVNELKRVGVVYVCASSGGILPITNLKSSPGFQVKFAKELKDKTGILTRAVGQISDFKLAQNIVESGDADIICIGRGYLHDPRWVWRAATYFNKQINVPNQYERGYLKL